MYFTDRVVILFLTLSLSLCTDTQGQELRIDHIILLVSNLERSVQEYTDLGFSIKPGSLHKNGLKNAHIKFENHSSLELMSIKGKATDEMAREYKSLLNQGYSGVYLSMSFREIENIEKVLNHMRLDYQVLKEKLWTYITFPNDADLAHLFFIQYHFEKSSSIENNTHANKMQSIDRVWIEGSSKVVDLLKNMGLSQSGKAYDSILGEGIELMTETGNIVVTEIINSGKRPVIELITLKKLSDCSFFNIRLPKN